MARPLLPNERAALDSLLTCEFEGAPALRRQAGSVVAEWSGLAGGSGLDEGSALRVELRVDASLPLAQEVTRVPVAASVMDEDGDWSRGLLLIVEGGRLSALYYWWLTDEVVHSFPDPAKIGFPEPQPRPPSERRRPPAG